MHWPQITMIVLLSVKFLIGTFQAIMNEEKPKRIGGAIGIAISYGLTVWLLIAGGFFSQP